VKLLIESLKDQDSDVQRWATDALVRIRSSEVFDALNNQSAAIRMKAARVLGRRRDRKAVQSLINTLGDESSDVRRETAEALGRIGSKDAIQPLISALRDEDNRVCRAAASALGNIGDKSAVLPLINVLDNEDPSVCRAAAYALGQIAYIKAVQDLLEREKMPVRRVVDPRSYPLGALGRIGGKKAVQMLLDASEDINPSDRRKAVEALGQISHDDTVQILVNALEELERDSRNWVVYTLGEIGEPSVELLTNMLKHKEWRVRVATVRALGRTGSKKATQPLINALEDRNSDVRLEAVTALGNLGDPRAVQSLINAMGDKKKAELGVVAIALGRIGDSRAVPALIRVLKDEGLPIDENAVKRRKEEYGKDAAQFYIQIVMEKALRERGYAARALGQIGDPEAITALTRVSGDDHMDLRIGDPEAISALTRALGDDHMDLRVQAVIALGQIGGKQAVPPLVGVLGCKKPRLREAASFALAHLGDKSNPKDLLSFKRRLRRGYRGRLSLLAKENMEIQTKTRTLDLRDLSPALQPVINALEDQNTHVREYAAKALGQLQDAQAIEPLVKALRGGDIFVRMRAKVALDALKWKPQTGQEAAMYQIAELGSTQHPEVSLLVEGLTHKDRRYRRNAGYALAWYTGRQIYRLAQALNALRQTGANQVFQTMVEASEDEDSVVRANVAYILGRVRDPQAVQPLVRALSDEEVDVRMAAATALGRIGDKRAVKYLVNALGDESKYVRLFVAEALDNLGWTPQTVQQKEHYQAAKTSWLPRAVKATPSQIQQSPGS
jgi:HEAT repeat protein